MRRKSLKKIIAVSMATMMAFSMAACGGSKSDTSKEKEEMDVTLDQIKLGEDYTDIKADLKFLTHRTDIVDTDFEKYKQEFNKMYPNINITYEPITDYANDVTTRLSTGDWGDICMIPTTVDKDELGNYFQKFGQYDSLSKSYDMLNNFRYGEDIYGIPSMANAQGIVYNKKVFEH